MSSRRRGRLITAGLAVTTLFAAAACGAGGSSVSSTGTSGPGSLTVLVEGGGKAELQPVADLYKQDTGNTVTFVELPYAGLYDRISTELASGNVSFDVAALDAIWLKAFADGVEPLDSMFTDAVKGDLFPSLVTEAKVGDHFVGMPVWTNAEILYYRTDLFGDPTEQANFKAKYGYDLTPPTTWQQFQDAAEFFTRAPTLYGTDVKGAVETEWLATVLQAGAKGMVLDADGKVIINDAEHKAALDYYSELNTVAKVSPAGAAQIDWAAAQNLFNQGQTAMTRFWAHAYTQIPTDAAVAGKVGVTVLPAGAGGSAAVPGAWYLSVPKNAKNSKLANEFIQFAYDHNELGLDTSLGLAARKSALQSFADKPGHENLKPLIATLEAPATAARPATPKWQQIVDSVLIPMIQKSVADSSNNQQLLDDAKKQIEEILG
ncbi:sugar ABC transporter substrate-binding protein [Pengzhenrongella phosphoraccumulans]